MNISNLIKRIQYSFKPQDELQTEVIIKFLHVLENARAEELSCNDMFARLDEFVETEVLGKDDAEKITPLVREHLDMCPDCCDEYEALLTVLENTRDR